MEKNLLGVKFKDSLFSKTEKTSKEYYLKKINIKQFPQLKNNLKSFFNDCNKYFETSYDDKYIVVGKRKNKNEKIKLINPFKEALSIKKGKSKKFVGRMTLRKPLSLKSTYDLTYNSPNRSKSITEERKKAFTTFEESSLKQGQRFIDDKEVDKMFSLYKQVKKINKNRYNNFLTVKELSEVNNNNLFNFKRTSRNFSKNILNFNNNQVKKLIINSEKRKKCCRTTILTIF